MIKRQRGKGTEGQSKSPSWKKIQNLINLIFLDLVQKGGQTDFKQNCGPGLVAFCLGSGLS